MDQIVGRQRQGELPVHPGESAMPGLRETRHRRHPAENLLDPFAVNLARLIPLARRHFLADIRAPARGVARLMCLDVHILEMNGESYRLKQSRSPTPVLIRITRLPP